ncbi:MAG: hypothetical protein R3E32_11340 [Chitinophagales bacterium]
MLQKKPPKAVAIEGFLSPKKRRIYDLRVLYFFLNGINPDS